MANAMSNDGKLDILQDYISGKTFKLMLLDDNHTPDIDNENVITDVSANEVSGTGYTAGGEVVANVAASVDDTNDRAYLDGDDVEWTSSTITYRYAYLYETDTNRIVGYYDPGSNQSSTSGTLKVAWATPATGGMLYLA